ncbi:hypothetical protein D3C71_1586390 [compost metagenome]
MRGRIQHGLHAARHQRLAGLGRIQAFLQRFVQAAGQRGVQLGRGQYAEPRGGLESRHAGFLHGGDIPRGVRARGAGHRDRLQLAALNEGQGRGQGVEVGVDSAADQVGDDLAAALIGDVLEIGHARRLHKELGGHVRDVAGSCGPIRHWGFAGLGIAQEIFQRLCRQLGVHDQDEWCVAYLRDRREVPQRIIGQPGREGGTDGLGCRDA